MPIPTLTDWMGLLAEQPGQEGLVEPSTLAAFAAPGLLLGGLARQELLLLTINDVLARVEVGLVGLDAASLVVELVAEDEDEVKRDTEVTGDEGLVLLLAKVAADEDIVVLGKSDDDAKGQSAVRAPDTEGGDVGKDLVGDVLGLAGLAPPDVGDKDRDPGQQTEDGSQVDEVAEDSLGVVGDVHEGQQREEGREAESVDRDATLVGALEDGGGRAIRRQSVEGTAGDVQIRVGRGEDEDADAGVDDVGDDLDTCKLGSDDERRSGGTGLGLVGESEVRGVVGNQHADEKNTQAVEEQDTVEGQLDRTGDGLAGVLGFGDSDTDKLSAQVGEGGVDHARPETEETARIASVDVLPEGTEGILAEVHNSLAEAFAVVVGTTAKGQDEREEDDANDGDDLEAGKPELKLAEELDAKVVDCDDDDKEDGDEDTRVHSFAVYPELDDEGSGPKRKTKRGIAEPRGVTGETRRDGEPSGHLTETSHNKEDDETDESVRDEDGAGAGLGEGLAGSDDETGTDGTTDGNHGDVAGLEAAVQRRVGAGLEAADVDIFGVVGLGVVARFLDIVGALRGGRPLDEAVAHGC
ncbi:uncharacterized protein ColSpa_06468 [Colletotrichum spaethianum]|uniref:Uncharacterized protein n=1 Tax=Colletotrichum spaethianum TaxID=700344 RepID=A0AA37LKZ0_9PEZI|nr:uncharacterized protein ColSpa_06468 [Colletotrichum spaethianum]GKT46287.1 hypothetical protein ColSpa_06468 [Colletotrichum spaethianum]